MDLIQKYFGDLFRNGLPKQTTEAKDTVDYRLEFITAKNPDNISDEEMSELVERSKEIFDIKQFHFED